MSYVRTASEQTLQNRITMYASNKDLEDILSVGSSGVGENVLFTWPEQSAIALSDGSLFETHKVRYAYEEAKKYSNPIALEAISLNMEPIPQSLRVWSAVNSGYEYFRISDLNSAIRVLGAAETYAENLSVKEKTNVLPKIYNNLGWSHFNAGNIEESQEYFIKAIKVNSNYYNAIFGLNSIEMQIEKTSELSDKYFEHVQAERDFFD